MPKPSVDLGRWWNRQTKGTLRFAPVDIELCTEEPEHFDEDDRRHVQIRDWREKAEYFGLIEDFTHVTPKDHHTIIQGESLHTKVHLLTSATCLRRCSLCGATKKLQADHCSDLTGKWILARSHKMRLFFSRFVIQQVKSASSTQQ